MIVGVPFLRVELERRIVERVLSRLKKRGLLNVYEVGPSRTYLRPETEEMDVVI